MTLRDYTANVISASKVVPDGAFQDSAASGVWDINEALDLIKGGNWPTTGNFNPAAFVDGLFQCHLYDGTGSQQTITNNIDFTKGGLIITKRRDSSTGNGPYWNDTERGVTNYVRSDSDGGTGAQNTSSTGAVVSTSSTGYAVGTFNGWNNSSGEYVSWSFRKQPKFFDIVTYSGTGSNQNISHSLGSTPGMIIIKDTSASNAWTVYHRGVDSSAPEDYSLNLGSDAARDDATSYFNDTAPTSSVFTVGTTARTNNNGSTYVAYLFAHNSDDSVQTSLQGKTLSNLGSAFDGSYPITEINDGVAETSNATSTGYVSNADMDISVDYGSAVVANAYYIAPQGDQGGSVYNTPTAFTAYGSNNGSSWTSLASFSSISGFAAGSYKEFTFSNTTAYRYYRLEITASSASGVSISEWELGLAPDASELGNFGELGDSNIIKCGSYTGNGSNTGSNSVTLGFEPQLVMIKRADSSGNWVVVDNMRGMFVNGTGNDTILRWNSTSNESSLAQSVLEPTATGFKLRSAGGDFNGNGGTYIYMAIRRGGMQTPSTASDVFAIDTAAGTSPSPPHFNSGFPIDFGFYRDVSSTADFYAVSRLIGANFLRTNTTAAEQADSSLLFDYQNGFYNASYTSANTYAWMWKRARGYFDVVTYTGTGSNRTVSHNLGVAPEMMWVKNRDTTNDDWYVYVSGITHLSTYGSDPDSYGSNPAALTLNSTDTANFSMSGVWNHTHPTSTVFSTGDTGATNGNGEELIAYLFASVTGVSKIGSYTGNGSSQTIDCGFSSGSKFVLIKRVSDTGHWQIWDTTRGLVDGNDNRLILNGTGADLTGYDMIDPDNSGFAVTNANDTNESGKVYIFYAIAA